MAIKHSTVIVAANVATDEVSANAWNAALVIEAGTIVNADISATADIAVTKLEQTALTEKIEDVVGAMVAGNTETGIAVTYDDTLAKLNFAVTATGGTYTPVTSRPTQTTDLQVYCYVSGTTPNRVWSFEMLFPTGAPSDTIILQQVNES